MNKAKAKKEIEKGRRRRKPRNRKPNAKGVG
jgi:hypothetical protein